MGENTRPASIYLGADENKAKMVFSILLPILDCFFDEKSEYQKSESIALDSPIMAPKVDANIVVSSAWVFDSPVSVDNPVKIGSERTACWRLADTHDWHVYLHILKNIITEICVQFAD